MNEQQAKGSWTGPTRAGVEHVAATFEQLAGQAGQEGKVDMGHATIRNRAGARFRDALSRVPIRSDDLSECETIARHAEWYAAAGAVAERHNDHWGCVRTDRGTD